MNPSASAQRLWPGGQGWTREKIEHVIASEETAHLNSPKAMSDKARESNR
jgi:hypothetical protein